MHAATAPNCDVSGEFARQINPMVRVGWGAGKPATLTPAVPVSNATAISGNSVTPMPLATICTRVASELASMLSLFRADTGPQKSSA